jgi:hypothetical protein
VDLEVKLTKRAKKNFNVAVRRTISSHPVSLRVLRSLRAMGSLIFGNTRNSFLAGGICEGTVFG